MPSLTQRPLKVILVFTVILTCFSVWAKDVDGSLCNSEKYKDESEFTKKILVASKEHDGDEYKYLNIDVDGDSISDDIVGGCSNSNPPADACVLSLKTSKGNIFEYSKFAVNERFFLFGINSKIYAYVTAFNDSKKSFRILRVGPSAVREICKK